MQPLGRQHYKNKKGGKHGTWWHNVCQPSVKRARQAVKKMLRTKQEDEQ